MTSAGSTASKHADVTGYQPDVQQQEGQHGEELQEDEAPGLPDRARMHTNEIPPARPQEKSSIEELVIRQSRHGVSPW